MIYFFVVVVVLLTMHAASYPYLYIEIYEIYLQ